MVACVVMAAAFARADIVVLDSGESLSGTFSRIRENTLVFRTSLEGQMMTPLANVKSLTVETPLYISMSDDRVYYGRLVARGSGQVIEPLDGGAPIPVNVVEIWETLPIPTPPSGNVNPAEQDWKLEAAPGAQWRSDGKTPAEPVLRLDASGKLKEWELRGDAVLERSDPDRFPAYLRARGEAFYGEPGSLRPFAGLEFERNLDRSLSDRTALSLGLYQALTAENTQSFSLMAALSAEQQQRRDEQRFLAGDSAGNDAALGLRLGLRFIRLFGNGDSLSESLTLFTNLAALDEFRARSETVFMLPVGNRLHLRLDLNIDYESPSYFGADDPWSATLGAGINMAF